MRTTRADFSTYMTLSHQPVTFVARACRIKADKLTQFLTNLGTLSKKETERLEAFLEQHPPSKRWRITWVRSAAVAAPFAVAACTTTVQEAVKTLWKALFN